MLYVQPMQQVFKFLIRILAIVGFAVVLTAIIIMCVSDWQKHLLHLWWRAASRTLAETSHTWLGFAALCIVAPFAVWLIRLGHRWRSLVRERRMSPLKDAFHESTKHVYIELGVYATVWLVILAVFLAKIIYGDHQDMANKIKQLKAMNSSQQQQIGGQPQQIEQQIKNAVQNALNPIKQENDGLKQEKDKLAKELEDRKQEVHTEDPSYRRFAAVLQILTDLQKGLGTKKCVIEMSIPTGNSAISSHSVASTFFLANEMARACDIYTPEEADPNNASSPDLQRRIMDGAEDGAVIMHTSREDGENEQWCRNFHDYLARYLSLKRSYDNMPKHGKNERWWTFPCRQSFGCSLGTTYIGVAFNEETRLHRGRKSTQEFREGTGAKSCRSEVPSQRSSCGLRVRPDPRTARSAIRPTDSRERHDCVLNRKLSPMNNGFLLRFR
jgi:hypothetical protein